MFLYNGNRIGPFSPLLLAETFSKMIFILGSIFLLIPQSSQYLKLRSTDDKITVSDLTNAYPDSKKDEIIYRAKHKVLENSVGQVTSKERMDR